MGDNSFCHPGGIIYLVDLLLLESSRLIVVRGCDVRRANVASTASTRTY